MGQGDQALPIFTAEIAGKPTIVLAARDHVAALAFVNDDFVRSELADLRTPDGAPRRIEAKEASHARGRRLGVEANGGRYGLLQSLKAFSRPRP